MSDSYGRRKFSGARRLLVATIGAATVSYAGCGEDTMTLVANLMAAPFMPPQDGQAGSGGSPQVSNPKGPGEPPAAEADQDGGVGGRDLGSQQ